MLSKICAMTESQFRKRKISKFFSQSFKLKFRKEREVKKLSSLIIFGQELSSHQGTFCINRFTVVPGPLTLFSLAPENKISRAVGPL